MFSGLLYCADCGEKLYYSASHNGHFFCSTYRKESSNCSAHYIREKVVEQLILDSMQRVLWYVQVYEKSFARQQMAAFGLQHEKELSERRKKLDKAKSRVQEIDAIIQQLYEDNTKDKVSDERFATMSLSLEREQAELKAAIPTLTDELDEAQNRTEDLQKFIDKAKKITRLTELTPELVHEFIQKIVVSSPRYLDGKRHQIVDIYYNGVGIIHEATAEEMEQEFQEHLRQRKSKTA